MLIFITSNLSFEYHGIYYTNTISNQITGIYWPNTKALYDNKPSHICHQLHSRFCKNAVSEVRCTLTFDLTTCYLVDPLIFSLQRRSENIPLKLMSTSQNVATRILTEIWKTIQTKLNISKVCPYDFMWITNYIQIISEMCTTWYLKHIQYSYFHGYTQKNIHIPDTICIICGAFYLLMPLLFKHMFTRWIVAYGWLTSFWLEILYLTMHSTHFIYGYMAMKRSLRCCLW